MSEETVEIPGNEIPETETIELKEEEKIITETIRPFKHYKN